MTFMQKAQEQCKRTASLNGILDRISIHGGFNGDDFVHSPAGETLIFCDIEGG